MTGWRTTSSVDSARTEVPVVRLARTGWGGRTRRAGAAVAIAGLAAVLGASSAQASVTAHVISGHGVAYVNVRGGASSAGAVIRTIPGGAAVSLECYKIGQAITGPYGVSTLWYNLTGGGWVTDALLETASNSAVTRNCSVPPPAPTVGLAWGRTSTFNDAPPDQCTWGAKQKFKEYSGVYPALVGNAKDWLMSARQTGWTPSSTLSPTLSWSS